MKPIKIILLALSMVVLVIIGGCLKGWDDIREECQKTTYNETCGYARCLYENSAGFSDDVAYRTRIAYLDCVNNEKTKCQQVL